MNKSAFSIKLALAMTAFLFLVGQSRADESSLSFKTLHIQISNQTGKICTLNSQQTIHGRLDSSPPQSLLIEQSASFDMQQIVCWYGPYEILSYQCGQGSKVTFEISQPNIIISGQEPVLSVTESNGIKATVTSATSSSFLYGSKSLMNIQLSSN